MMSGKLIVLSGPSCAGKSPLAKALARLYPDLHASLQPLVLYNSRAARPGEVDGIDYYFRGREAIASFQAREDMAVMEVRGDLQSLDLNELNDKLSQGDVLFEGNPFVGHLLLTHPKLDAVNSLSVFMSPLSADELNAMQSAGADVPSLITDVMRRKLLRRTRKQKGALSLKDLENIEKRAGSAPRELQLAHAFEHILVNHDGEDSENWDAFYYPLGDARKTLLNFVSLLQGQPDAETEQWQEGRPV